MIFLRGFISFRPNSCCKLFIYLLGKRKIYVGHQDPTERFFLARNDNWLRLKCIISHIFFFDVLCRRFSGLDHLLLSTEAGNSTIASGGSRPIQRGIICLQRSKRSARSPKNVCKNTCRYSFASQPILLLINFKIIKLINLIFNFKIENDLSPWFHKLLA